MAAQVERYAIVVRRAEGLFYFSQIVRADDDIYLPGPERPDVRGWNPHVSLHRNGELHCKDFDSEFMQHRMPKPDQSFQGTENVVCLAVNFDQWQTLKQPFLNKDFADVFEIPLQKLKPNSRSQLHVDIVQPGFEPVPAPQMNAIEQKVFKNRVPWVAVTLFGTSDV